MSYCLNPDCPQPENQNNAQTCLTCGTKLLLKKRYRAVKPIGQGGFGRTFLAVDENKPSKSACVIKQFLPQAQGTNNSQQAAKLFQQEALRLNNLGQHDQIPNLLEYLTEESHQYLVQEYIDGHNLAQILAEQGTFKEQQIWELLNSLLPVLEFIHDREVIHRDIKPQNIIRSRNGKLYLVDFGAAKVLTGTALLQTGTSIGTPEFVAPEQIRGKATYSSDLYSLGTTCIYLLTEISPFDLFDISEYTWVWRQYLVDNPVSDKLSNILDKLIENATSRRYQSATEVLKDIHSQSALTVSDKQSVSEKKSNKVSNRSKIKPFNNSSWQCIDTLTAHKKSITSIDISPDGKLLVSGSHDGTIKLWSINTGKLISRLYNGRSVYTVAFSPDGSIIASGDSANKIKLWHVNSGKKIRIIKAHQGFFTGVYCLKFSREDQIIVSAGGDKTVKLSDVNTGKLIRTLKNHNKLIRCLDISPDGKLIVSASVDGTAIIWELNTGKILKILDAFDIGRSVAFSPDGQIIATGSDNNTIKLWEVISGQEICTLDSENWTKYLNFSANWVRYVIFSPNGEILATTNYSGDIKLWDINTKQEISTLTGHLAKVNSLAFSPDGQTLFSASKDQTIKIWRHE